MSDLKGQEITEISEDDGILSFYKDDIRIAIITGRDPSGIDFNYKYFREIPPVKILEVSIFKNDCRNRQYYVKIEAQAESGRIFNWVFDIYTSSEPFTRFMSESNIADQKEKLKKYGAR